MTTPDLAAAFGKITATMYDQVVAALTDSGWLGAGAGFTLASGFTASNNLAVRRIGNRVQWRGEISGTFAATTTVTALTVLAPFIPTNPVNSGVGWTNANDYGRMQIASPSGTMVVQCQVAATAVSVDHLSYLND